MANPNPNPNPNPSPNPNPNPNPNPDQVRPTFVDGELCILRAPAVHAGPQTLRPERVYLLRRMKNRLDQVIGARARVEG